MWTFRFFTHVHVQCHRIHSLFEFHVILLSTISSPQKQACTLSDISALSYFVYIIQTTHTFIPSLSSLFSIYVFSVRLSSFSIVSCLSRYEESFASGKRKSRSSSNNSEIFSRIKTNNVFSTPNNQIFIGKMLSTNRQN